MIWRSLISFTEHLLLGEAFADLFDAGVAEGANLVGGFAENLSDLLIGFVLHVAEDEGFADGFGERFGGVEDEGNVVGFFGGDGGAFVGVGMIFN